jgi:hypothetical protein
MYIAHYLIPFIFVFIYLIFFKKEKIISNRKLDIELIKLKNKKIFITTVGIIFFGLLLANLIDLDHIFLRILGDVPWFGTSCGESGLVCSSINFYPLHSLIFLIASLVLTPLIFFKDNKIKFFGWLFLGVAIHLGLDYIQYFTGFGF